MGVLEGCVVTTTAIGVAYFLGNRAMKHGVGLVLEPIHAYFQIHQIATNTQLKS